MKIILNQKKSWTGEGGARKTLSGVRSHAVTSLHRKYTLASVLVSLQVRRLDSPLLSLMQAAERDIFCHLFSERLPKSHFGPWQFTPSSPLLSPGLWKCDIHVKTRPSAFWKLQPYGMLQYTSSAMNTAMNTSLRLLITLLISFRVPI